MARPPLPVGSWGSINVQQTGEKSWRARARYRDQDGVTRPVVRYGKTAAAATLALRTEFASREAPRVGENVTGDTRVSAWAVDWLDSVDHDPKRKQATRDRYRWIVERVVVPALGGLRLREVDTQRAQRFLDLVRDERGAATARTTKAVLAGMFGRALRFGALAGNPIRETDAITSAPKPVRALTRAEQDKLMRRLRRDEVARSQDLPDLCEFLAGTGARIGEACALLPEDIDLEAGTVHIRATVTDRGRQSKTKTAAGQRRIVVPAAVVALLRRRLADRRLRTDVAVFPSPLGHLRDTSNTASTLRRAFDRAGFDWVTSHTFRRTVASRLHEAGVPARVVSDYLGHSQIAMTLDRYTERSAVGDSVTAEALA